MTAKDGSNNRVQSNTVRIANGHRIYSIELDEINKASERFQGLSDAAEESADRATKTPHVDGSIIAQIEKKSSEGTK